MSQAKAVTRYRWASAFCTDPGPTRRVNEDAYLEAPDAGFWAVTDGMGGHEDGQLASRMVIEALDSLPASCSRYGLLQAVQRCLADVNCRLQEVAQQCYDGRPIGCTIALLMAYGDSALCLWAGDSRLYRLRQHRLHQITRDHSHLQELIDQGRMGEGDPRAPTISHILTRAIGAAPQLVLDTRVEKIEAGDVFLLCTDGLYRTISEDEIQRTLVTYRCADAARTLLHQALARHPRDNVTVGVVCIGNCGA
jgi:serine/threonine protein phosphatase PrpC